MFCLLKKGTVSSLPRALFTLALTSVLQTVQAPNTLFSFLIIKQCSGEAAIPREYRSNFSKVVAETP